MTYYIRTDGSDVNDGRANTTGRAWRTIEHTASQVAPGDTVGVVTVGNAE